MRHSRLSNPFQHEMKAHKKGRFSMFLVLMRLRACARPRICPQNGPVPGVSRREGVLFIVNNRVFRVNSLRDRACIFLRFSGSHSTFFARFRRSSLSGFGLGTCKVRNI